MSFTGSHCILKASWAIQQCQKASRKQTKKQNKQKNDVSKRKTLFTLMCPSLLNSHSFTWLLSHKHPYYLH